MPTYSYKQLFTINNRSQPTPPGQWFRGFYKTIMSDEKIYAEKTGEDTIAIHCDLNMAERLYEGICKIFGEYTHPYPANWKEEKRALTKLKLDIEELLPKQ